MPARKSTVLQVAVGEVQAGKGRPFHVQLPALRQLPAFRQFEFESSVP